MRALIVSQPDKLELREISAPKPGPYEALVRIRGCGICATTDWELIHGRQPFHSTYPAVLGHEAVGEIIETGTKVTSFSVGDFVTRPVSIWPGETRDGLASAWGGFADLGIVRDRKATANNGDSSLLHDYTALRQQIVPPDLTIPQSVLAISLAETASWFRYLPPVGGKTVCIAGTGIAGLGMVLWSLLAGAGKIVILGRRDERLALAEKLGATHGINVRNAVPSKAVRELNDGRGADFFLEAAGLADQVEVGLSVVAPGGTIAIYGVPEGQRYQLSLGAGPGWANICHYPAEEHLAYGWVASLIKRGIIPIADLMTHSWKLENHDKAFAEVAAGTVVKSWLEIG